MGRADVLKTLQARAVFADERFGAITVKDILAELEKPGRDPRPDFRWRVSTTAWTDIKDLQPGMVLEGTVSNVAQFGAFVDLGVHQDGLVHVSQLATSSSTTRARWSRPARWSRSRCWRWTWRASAFR
jgi:protein Tex